MGIFDKKEKSKADFSNVQSGSSTRPDPTRTPEPTEPTERSYTVQPGDSLSAIARREYGNANEWRRIFEANRDQIENPDLIHPGQELRIPAAEEGESR